MTSEELQELHKLLKDMNIAGKILLYGIMASLILPVWIYFNKNEEFVISITCFICVTFFFVYITYWRPVTNLKKDIEKQVIDSTTTIVVKVQGADTNTTIKTKSKMKLNYFEFDRFKVPMDKVNVNTKLKLEYARYSKHIFSLSIID